jgi:SpoVK/Ycf46/Vps4 family AAA+-type ATPase
MTGTILAWMQNREAEGIVLIGPPGTAKSMIGKAAGNTGGIPTIAFDLSAMKSGIVGSSGERLRAALSIIDAVSGGRSLWLATCNSIATLPPELRRRFTLGTFFFDLPSPEERETIWRIYTEKYQISGARPQDDHWTGAEIKECCRKAYRLRMSLQESAAYIVPLARSASEQIETLRQQSSAKYLSASRPGVYEYNQLTAAAPRGRALRQLAAE